MMIEGGPWEGNRTELKNKYHGDWCTYPNGTNFTWDWPSDGYNANVMRSTGTLADMQCKIGFETSLICTIAVIVLSVAIWIDEFFNVLDKTLETGPWDKIRIPFYIFSTFLLIVGNVLVIATHASWVISPDQSWMNSGLIWEGNTPCTTPSRIGLLLLMMASLLLFIEIGEFIYAFTGPSSAQFIKRPATEK
eukprot:TRINITY_DN1816_c0_g1_i1.p1 TRINITY_DN1816_c0_g1~~TRINITY_DN1816_c0_g1_i1.p1  ORF type:complete len:192 (-),score=16.16 TRINITY_DN1816_c0_g1_i1:100-675(-)